MWNFKLKQTALFGAMALYGMSAQAQIVSVIDIGTWNVRNNSVADNSTNNPGGLEIGQKYVIKATYDTTQIHQVTRPADGGTYYEAPLLGNNFQVFIPLQGLNTIATQTGTDFFALGGGYAPNAEIHFADQAGSTFLGYEFESQFLSGGLVYEQFTGGTNGNTSVGQILAPNLGPPFIFSQPATANAPLSSFLAAAQPVTANAGPALAYSAANQTVTTDGGSPQNNNLGAGRTDHQDFLSYNWTVNGSNIAGNLPGNPPHAPATDKANISVAIENSGLKHTTDTTQFKLTVSEGITGLSGSASTQVSYQNTAPTATADNGQGGKNVVYSATALTQTVHGSVQDPDLAINSKIAGFESETFAWSQGGSALPGSPSQDLTVALKDAGLKSTLDTTTFQLKVTDLAGASGTDHVNVSYQNSLPTIDVHSATDHGNGSILFQLAANDKDLAVGKALGLANFENLKESLYYNGSLFSNSAFDSLLNNGSAIVDNATLLSLFGVGTHELDVHVADLYLQSQGQYINAAIDFTVQAVPVPPSGIMFLSAVGLLGRRLLRRNA